MLCHCTRHVNILDKASTSFITPVLCMQILLLENLRFHSGDTLGDPELAKLLAKHVDVFINDAFGISHRHDASSVGICEHAPRLFPGMLMRAELQRLLSCLDPPQRHEHANLRIANACDQDCSYASFIQRVDFLICTKAISCCHPSCGVFYFFLLISEQPVVTEHRMQAICCCPWWRSRARNS